MKKQFIPIVVFVYLSFFFICCNNAADKKQPETPKVSNTTLPQQKEDSVVTKIRPVLFTLENKELGYNGHAPFDLTLSNIRYTLISQKDYYSEQLSSLQAQVKYSTNKEKTDKALNYLSDKIKASPAVTEIYKVQFHLKAIVDKTKYDEEKILYLKKDLSLLELIFPQ